MSESVPSSTNVANATNSIQSSVKFDRDAIEQHFVYLHHAAERAKVEGKLVLAVYGEDPDTRERFAEVRHFQVGDVEGVTDAAMEFDGVPHRNVYAPLAVMRPDLEPGKKGGEGDVVVLLAFVIDGDADKGKDRPTSPLPADYIVESSAGNFQEFLFLEPPLHPEEAKEFGRALQRATKAEFADDISHVWRVPGTLNWPNAAKVHERARPREPQPVRIHKPWDKWTKVDDLRTTLKAHWEDPRHEPLTPRGEFKVCPIKARDFHRRLRDIGYYDRDPDDPETTRKRYVHAAKALSYDLGDEGRPIFEDFVCWKGEREDEGTAVDPKESEYRWHECSRLSPRAKPITHGSIIKEAKELYEWKGPEIYLQRDKTVADMFGDTVAQLAQVQSGEAPLAPGTQPANDMRLPETANEAATKAEEAVEAAYEKEIPTPDGGFIKTEAEFLTGFVPPDYLVTTILQRRFCYSMTAQTGTGKTAVAMLIAAHVATGRLLGNLAVKKGTVIYFAGENPTDIQMRWLGLKRDMGLTGPVDVHFVEGPMHLSKVADRITREVVEKGLNPSFIVVDTSAAYFETDNDNDNVQAGDHARRMRSLTLLPGGPCVLVLCHPTKNAKDDDLIPRGGGAFLNEVDGNIALRNKDGVVAASALGKFRGPEFPALHFALHTMWDHPILRDADGVQIPTVVARPISHDEKARREDTGRKDEDAVLEFLCNNPRKGPTEIARALDWKRRAAATPGKEPEPDHQRATRALDKLKAEKLVEVTRGKWKATAKGQQDSNVAEGAKNDRANMR